LDSPELDSPELDGAGTKGAGVRRAALVGAVKDILDGTFNPARGLVGPPPYFLPLSLGYAWLLLASGAPAERERAEVLLTRALEAQQVDPGGADYGHIRILADDPVFEDLNSVRLVLLELIPLLRLYGPSLSPALRARLTEGVRAGLCAVDATEVHPGYLNVALLDGALAVLGGEHVEDTGHVQRGLERLERLVNETAVHGLATYGSPTYLGQTVVVLATLAEHAATPRARRLALGLQERLWLHVAARYHPKLAQLCGPYARAEPGDTVAEGSYIGQILDTLLGSPGGLEHLSPYVGLHLATRTFALPDYLRALALAKRLPTCVQERAGTGRSITSYLGTHHTLGTASRSGGSQARNLLAHAAPRSSGPPKVLYARLLAEGEPRDLNADPEVAEWGLFASVQAENRAVCLYGLPGDYRRLSALRTELVVTGSEAEDRVWCGGAPLVPGEPQGAEAWVCFDLGAAYVAVYPLAPTLLDAAGPPVTLFREGERLRLEIRHYRGPPRTFWRYMTLPWVAGNDTETLGPFFRGNLRAGFLIETADAGAHGSFEAFCRTVENSRVEDTGDEARRLVRTSRGERTLELALDLCTFAVLGGGTDAPGDPAATLSAPGLVQFGASPVTLSGKLARASAPGPWLALEPEPLAVNPLPQEVSLHVGGARYALPPFSRRRLEGEVFA